MLSRSVHDPDRAAVCAFDGSAVSVATIDLEQADGYVSVRRVTPHAVLLLRVMRLQAGERDSEAVRGAALIARARWRERTLVGHGRYCDSTLAVPEHVAATLDAITGGLEPASSPAASAEGFVARFILELFQPLHLTEFHSAVSGLPASGVRLLGDVPCARC